MCARLARCRRHAPRGNPRRANTRSPASSSRRIVRLPWARSSRCDAGVPAHRFAAVARRPAEPAPTRHCPTVRCPPPTLPTPRRAPGRPRRHCHARRHPTRGGRRFADAPAYVAERGWPLSYAFLDRLLRRGRGRARPPRRRRRAPSSRSCSHRGPSTSSRYLAAAKVGAVTAGVNDRLTATERATVIERADAARSSSRHRARPGRATTPSRSPPPHQPTSCCATCASAASAPHALPADPDRPVAIVFTSGTTGAPKGALYCNRQLAFITQTDVGDTWGGGTRGFTGTSFAHLGFMTKLPGNLRRGGMNFIMTRWSARGALAAPRARAHDDRRRRPDPARPHAPPTRLRRVRPRVASSTSSSAVVRSRRGSPTRRDGGSGRSSRAATRAPRPASVSGPRSTTPTRTRSSASGRPHAAVELPRARRRRPGGPGRVRSARSACAPPP